LLPYLKPDVWAATARFMPGGVAGVPWVTIVGVLSALASLYVVILAFKQPLAVGPISWQSITATIVTFLWGVVAFYISRWYHRSRGIDPALAMAEIPPE